MFQALNAMNMNKLLELLVCPKCRAKLEALPDREQPEGLCCRGCQKVYPIKEGIPVMLMEEALALTQWEEGLRSREVR